MKKIVVIGGGHGQATVLRGLKNLKDIDITAVVTVSDDGGSTGRLREAFDIPAMGDIRNVMIALAKSSTLLSLLMDYRFETGKDVAIDGHNLGNLILTALTAINADFMEAVSSLSKVLNLTGTVLPATTEIVTLKAEMENGLVVSGETNITKHQAAIKRVYFDNQVKATPQVIKAINQADLIILGIGSLYTSILPNLIIEDIQTAISQASAPLLYMCNIMTQPGETDNYGVKEHVSALENQLLRKIDCVVKANDWIPADILKRYQKENSYLVKMNQQNPHYEFIEKSLLDDFTTGLIRHSFIKIERFFREYLEEI